MLTTVEMKEALPSNLRGRVDQELVDKINNSITDPEMSEVIKENILGYLNVVQTGRIKITDYVNAVKYVTYKLSGDANIAAWSKVFPEKLKRLRSRGVPDKDIHAHVSIYSKGKIVNQIFEQVLIPTHLLNADTFQKAINVQASLMNDINVSPKVRSDAANSLLTHLKRPETQKIELDVGVKDNSMMRELKEITVGLAAQQQKMIQQGAYSPKEIAHQEIVIEGEVEDDDS